MKYKKLIYTVNDEIDNKEEEYIKNKNASELGKLGGQATVKKHGKKHFSKAGKKGALKRWGKVS